MTRHRQCVKESFKAIVQIPALRNETSGGFRPEECDRQFSYAVHFFSSQRNTCERAAWPEERIR